MVAGPHFSHINTTSPPTFSLPLPFDFLVHTLSCRPVPEQRRALFPLSLLLPQRQNPPLRFTAPSIRIVTIDPACFFTTCSTSLFDAGQLKSFGIHQSKSVNRGRLSILSPAVCTQRPARPIECFNHKRLPSTAYHFDVRFGSRNSIRLIGQHVGWDASCLFAIQSNCRWRRKQSRSLVEPSILRAPVYKPPYLIFAQWRLCVLTCF